MNLLLCHSSFYLKWVPWYSTRLLSYGYLSLSFGFVYDDPLLDFTQSEG